MVTLEIGRVIERYRVEERLGEGGTAVVYRVRHVHLGTDHALKVLTLPGAQGAPRLLLEGRVQAGVRHPNIVAVSDVLEVDGTFGLLMEFVPPPSLAIWLTENRPPLALAEALFRGIVEGVRHAHRHGLVHRDLKPGNVLLARGDQGLVPKVADFGLARLLDDDDSPRHTRSGLAMGTVQYMPPEQFRDAKGVDRRADLFALGCILHELVSGGPAFAWTDLITVHNTMMARGWAPLPPNLPGRVRSAIEGCLEPDRDARIPDCATLLAVLDGETSFRGPTLVPGAETLARLEAATGVGAAATMVAHEPVREEARRIPMPPPVEPPPTAVLPDSRGTLLDQRPGDSVFEIPPEPPFPFRSMVAGLVGIVGLMVVGWVTQGKNEPEVVPPVVTQPVATPPVEEAVTTPPVEPPAEPVGQGSAPPKAERPQTRTAVESASPAAPETPAPTVAPPTAPSAAPSPPAAPTRAHVRVTGVATAWLEGPAGRVSLPGKVAPGTYEVWADFGGGARDVGPVDVPAGDVTIACTRFQQCKVAQ